MTYRYTKQQAFDIAYLGVLNQGGPSLSGLGCTMRAINGEACAAGWLIGDDEVNQHHPGEALVALGGLAPDSIVMDMQAAHDDAAHRCQPWPRTGLFQAEFHKRMLGVAKIHGLTIPEDGPQ